MQTKGRFGAGGTSSRSRVFMEYIHIFRVVDRQCVGAWQACQVTCGYSTLRGVKSLQRSVFALVPPSKPVFHFLFPWCRDPSLYFARLALVRCWFAGGRSWSVISR
jgi:hypothetical protein